MTGSFHIAEQGAADGNLPKVSSGPGLAELGVFASSALPHYLQEAGRQKHPRGRTF